MRRKKRLAAVLGALLLFALSAIWLAAPYFAGDAIAELGGQTPVREFLDDSGERVRVERTWDYQWRFDLPENALPEKFVAAIIAVEDENFYRHHGVDYPAVLRAAWQNLRGGRTVSGASTLTMQLAGLNDPPGRRSLWRKLRQMIRARRLEQLYSKQRILREYVNRVPFGGKLHGVEAAARGYFGMPAAELNTAETALLCGIPQRPNRLRPDRHPEAARRRLKNILGLLEERGAIPPGRAEEILRGEKIRFRDFTRPFNERDLERDNEDSFFFRAAGREAGEAALRIHTSLNRELQHRSLQMLRRRVSEIPDVGDAALIVVENPSGKIIAEIGTLDWHTRQAGEVDAAGAVRSAGSTLKPFIYAEALGGGMIVMDTILEVAPLRYGGYAPGNYDGEYRGGVTAAEALADSLNTPAVRLLAQLGVERLRQRLSRLGFSRANDEFADRDGLALALGSGGATLRELVAAYTVLAGNGECAGLTRLAAAPPRPMRRLLPSGVAAMVSAMLRSNPLPECRVSCAWKTGTSNGRRDGWCFAYTPRYTVGVWMGNKDGGASATLAGRDAAAAAAEVMNQLYDRCPPPKWPSDDSYFEPILLCRKSGLRPSAKCAEHVLSLAISGIPLRKCAVCGGAGKPPRILAPAPGAYFAADDSGVELPLNAVPPHVGWRHNGRPFTPAPDSRRRFPIGRHRLDAVDENGRSTTVEFSVSRPER